ncbi:MAG: cupredoxin family copper-binding protein [Chloroflexota bacterium]
MRSLISGAALVAGLLLAGCGGAATSPAASAPVAASAPAASAPAASAAGASTAAGGCQQATGTAKVSADIQNFAFPATLQAKVGDVVGWTNKDSAAHTVTLDDGSCDTGNIASGASAMLSFNAPGTYSYHCTIHSSMKGKLEVTG